MCFGISDSQHCCGMDRILNFTFAMTQRGPRLFLSPESCESCQHQNGITVVEPNRDKSVRPGGCEGGDLMGPRARTVLKRLQNHKDAQNPPPLYPEALQKHLSIPYLFNLGLELQFLKILLAKHYCFKYLCLSSHVR